MLSAIDLKACQIVSMAHLELSQTFTMEFFHENS